MILRRITEHVKAQNWFAVGLDFFIVVAGILIAFQINSWADRQAVQKSAKASLTMLLTELMLDIERLDVVAESQKARIDAYQRVTQALMDAEPIYDEIADDIELGYNNRTFLMRDTVYDSMEKEGQLFVLPLELQRKISVTYGYDFPTLAMVGLQMDDNQDEVISRCIDLYWDWDLRTPISQEREDLARLRNCFVNLRDYSKYYLHLSKGEFRGNAEVLKAALEVELDVSQAVKDLE